MSYLKSFCLVLLLPAALYGSTVVINEFLALNSRSGTDPQHQYEDWIELYNRTDTAIDVGGMYLTDDLSEPNKWQIPAGNPAATTIAPEDHLVIWADDETQDSGLHAGFRLSADGEEIGLFDVDGHTLIDSVTFGPQASDISYGRYPDGTDDWHYASFPSPGSSNYRVYQGVVSPVTFSQPHGFYDGPFEVTLTCDTPGVTIYYTTDGREPYDQSGRFTTGSVYDGPIPIDKTTCLRARGVRSSWMSSRIETCTYLFLQDIITQSADGRPPSGTWPSGSVNGQILDYGMDPDVVNDPRYADLMDDALLSIPSISIVTSRDNLFNAQTGIYVNAQQEGSGSERPASVELLNPDGSEGFQIDAGLRIRGGYSRSGSNPKHAFRLLFRREYGGALEYPLFGDEGADWFENVDLRCSQNYSWSFGGDSQNTMVREVFSRDVQGDMGHPYTRSRYYHLYLDGQYWGLYQTQERSEASYAATYLDGDKEDFDVVKSESGSYSMRATDGNMDAYRRLYDAAIAGLADNQRYYQVQGLNPDGTPNPDYEPLLDVDNLIDYMIIDYYTGDRDGPGSRFVNRPNNTYGIFNRENPDGWKWFQHDSEHTLGVSQSELNLVTPFTSAGAQWAYFNPHWLHEQLAQTNASYRMRFADRVYHHFFNDGLLTPEGATAAIMYRAGQIDLAIIAESARWGDSRRSTPLTKQHWENEIDRLVSSYIPGRTQTVLSQFESVGWYPAIDPPVFNINDTYQHGGYVAAGDQLSMSGGTGMIWYTVDGNDPLTPGVTAGGVSAQLTLVSETTPMRVLVPTDPVNDTWRGGRGFDDSSWIGGTGGVGYERNTGYEHLFSIDVQNQMYGRNASCYVRIPFDVSADSVSALSSLTLKLRYDDGFIAYLNGVEVQRVLFSGTAAWNSSATASHSDIDAISQESFDISAYAGQVRAGQNILAIHGLNESTTSSDFLISVELTAVRSGGDTPSGMSPSVLRYTGPMTLTSSTRVKVRTLSGSTWSALNEATFAVGPVAESLRISEIMYHPIEMGSPDDPNAEYIELTNIGTETINLNLVKFTNGVDFTFPSVDLAPGDYVVVVRDAVAFEARYGADVPVGGQYVGSLNNAGERIELQDAAGQVIHSFRFRDNWYDLTDGLGFSLTVKDPAATDPSAYGDKSIWRPSANADGSPGYDDRGAIAELGAVVINEVMAAGATDWVELYNTTDQAVDLGGWFLSDSRNDLTKYEIAAGTIITPGGYVVFYENQHFNNAHDPGCHVPFGLSRNGETVYLHSGADGVLTGYSEEEKFDASEAGVSFGRYRKSTGAYNFVPLSQPTPGLPNAAPKVGPIVINEIMYNPAASGDAEYVELLNLSSSSVMLYDAVRGAPWRFTDDPDNPAIEYLFPNDPAVILAPGECLVLTKDLAAFEATYGAPAGVQVFAWGEGRLSNGGDKIQLSSPGEAEADGTRHWIRVDRVVYSDGAHPDDFTDAIDPWPPEADGQGASLIRLDPGAYGNDPANWQAGAASPGTVN